MLLILVLSGPNRETETQTVARLFQMSSDSLALRLIQSQGLHRIGKIKYCISMFTNRICKPFSNFANSIPDPAGKSSGSAEEKVVPRRKRRKTPSSENVSCNMSSRQRVTWARRREITQPELGPINATFESWRSHPPKVFSASAQEISPIGTPLVWRRPSALAILTG